MALRLSTRINASSDFPDTARLGAEMRGAIARSLRIGRRITQANTRKRTGRTARTVRSSLLGGGARVTGYFGSDDRIFSYLEEGTPPHVIRPRRAKALYWPGAAHPVKKVNHPGTRAYRQLERSGPTVGGFAKRELRAAIGRVL